MLIGRTRDTRSPGMRVAFAAWNDRIAPLFDVARRLHVVDTRGGRIVRQSEEPLVEPTPAARAACLARLGIDALVCGAISRPQEALIQAYGVRVVAFVSGGLREVVEAWRARTLGRESFAMPGCGGGRGRRFRGGRRWGRESGGSCGGDATRRRSGS
jgi:predicted Fe-Mo cluster-binding NifX family protein